MRYGCGSYLLVCETTCTAIIEIIFLLICVFERFLIVYASHLLMKIICALDVGIFTHIVIMLLLVIKNIFFIFWKNKLKQK